MEATTPKVNVGVHIGRITSYLGKGATQAQVPTHPEPDADSRPGARPRQPPAELSTGTLLERCDAPVDLPNPTPGSRVIQSTKCWRGYLMTIRARLRSQSPLPTPSTLRSSSGFLNGPWASRDSTIFSAARRPMPFSLISSLTSAGVMVTGAPDGTGACGSVV